MRTVGNSKVRKAGIAAAVAMLCLSYVCFLRVNIVGFFAFLMTACALGVIFGEDPPKPGNSGVSQ